jgi:gliding motility-associated-like protein
VTLTSTTCTHKPNRNHALREAFIAVILLFSSALSFAIDVDNIFILPSFTVDATEGAGSSGFIVHTTNTTIDIDTDCALPEVYTWSVNGGVQGFDWEFAEGTSENDVTVAIEFITQGCYQIQMSVLECNTQNNATPIEITVAGQPDITFNDISSLSSCTNINVGTLWQLASNNNLSVDFEILLDGSPLSSNTYIASASCTTPGLVDFADVFSTGFLIAGMHQLVFNATGDINTVTTTVVINFEIFQTPSITLFVPPVCEDSPVDCSVFTSEPATSIVFTPTPSAVNGLSATYDTGTVNNSEIISIVGEMTYGSITCSTTTSQIVVLQENPDVAAIVTPATVCSGQSSTVQGTGAGVFTWNSTPLPCQINNITNQAIFCDVQSAISSTMTGYLTYSSTGVTCATTVPFSIDVTPLPELTLIDSPSSGCVGDAVSYEVTSLTNSGVAEYLWYVNGVPQSGSDTPLFSTNLSSPSPFEVSVMVTEPSGCSAILNMSTLVWENPVVTATPNTLNYPICLDMNLPICATGAETYDWEGDSNLSGNCVDVPFTLFANDGVISVTGSSTFGTTTCSTTFDFIVQYEDQPVIEVTSSGSVCAGDDITLIASGGVAYFWDSNPIPDVNNGNSITFNNLNIALISGNVIGTGANGCSSTTSFSYTINASPVATLGVLDSDNVYCTTEIATIETALNFGSPPYTIEWSQDGMLLNTETVSGPFSDFPFDLTGLGSTSTISIDVTDGSGCVTQDAISIELYEGVEFSLTSSPACEGDAVEFVANGNAMNYEWPSPLFTGGNTNTNSAIVANGTNVEVTGTITYPSTTIGELICSGTASNTAVVQQNPVLSINPLTGAFFCADLSPIVTASGADSYSWSPAPLSQNNGTATYPTFMDSPFEGSVTGEIVYPGISCFTDLAFSLDILDLPDVELAVDGALICGTNEALITTGGMDPLSYTFEWTLNSNNLPSTDNSILIPFVFPDDAGVQNVSCVATDNNGCVGESSIDVEVLENAQLNLSTSPICEGDTLQIDIASNGVITWDVMVAIENTTGVGFYPVSDGEVFTATSTLTVPSILFGSDVNCSTESTVVSDVRDNPEIVFSLNGLACEGSDITIDISGAESYVWVSSPNEDASSEGVDSANPGQNILSLSFIDIAAGNLNMDVTGSIIFADAAGLTCATNAVFDREINLVPSFSFDGLNAICTGSCINFEIDWDNTPALPLTLDWTLDGTSYTNGNTFDFCPLYTAGSSDVALFVLDGNNCTANSALTVTMSEYPVVTLGADVTEGCSPVTVNFNSTSTLSSVSAWNFGNGSAPTGTANPQVTFECDNYALGDCVYAVSFTAISASNPNCITTENVDVTVHPIPVAEFTFEQDAICFDENGAADILIENASSDILGLTCSGGVEPYSWTVFPTGVTDCTETNDQAPMLVASGTGVFSIGLVVTDIEGCTAQTFNAFEVYDLPVPEVNFLQSSICLPLEVEILNTSIGAATFEIEVPGFVIPNNFASPHTIEVIFPGIYEAEFIVTSEDGCIVRLEIDTAFQAWHPPIANFIVTPEEITILDPIVTFGNESEGGTEYIWSFGDGEGSSEVSPEHEYERADTYEVQLLVTNEYGCTDAATQTIFVNSELQVFVPNAFTPNNDGNNDAWLPQVNGEEFIISYECWVYDRWGKLVFNSTTIGEPWIGDNTSDGNGTHFVSSTESFIWKIELKQVDGRGAKISTGNVFLIR